jgi:hypothetical protein
MPADIDTFFRSLSANNLIFCIYFNSAEFTVLFVSSFKRRPAAPTDREPMHLNLAKKGLLPARHKNLIQCFSPGIHPNGQKGLARSLPVVTAGRLLVPVGRSLVVDGRLLVLPGRLLLLVVVGS